VNTKFPAHYFRRIGNPATTIRRRRLSAINLVRETRRFAKGTRQRVVWHDTNPTSLVTSPTRTPLAAERLRRRDASCDNRDLVHQVGKPQRQAVDEASAAAIGRIERSTSASGGFSRSIHSFPAPGPVPRDTFAHLCIERFGRGDVDWLAGKPRRGIPL